MSTKRN